MRSAFPPAKPWLLPVRDALSFAVFVASFFGRTVFWRDQVFRVEPSGRMTVDGDKARMMKTLFLHPPSFDGFDGGAGSRYQAKREIRSFWYPTWLAQPAALVPGSRLIDAPPARLKLDDVLPLAGDYELAVLHTSTPSFASDVKVAEALKDANPRLKIGLVGAKVAVEPEDSLEASAAVDFVAREEFDFTIKEVAEGRPFDAIDGLSFRSRERRHRPQPRRGRCSRTWTGCPSSPKSTSAT